MAAPKDPAMRAQLVKSSSTSTSMSSRTIAPRSCLASRSRDAYLEAHPEAGGTTSTQNSCTRTRSVLLSTRMRIFEDGLREDEIVLERRTEGRSGTGVYKSAGRNSETML